MQGNLNGPLRVGARGYAHGRAHPWHAVPGRPGVLVLTPDNASDVTTAPAVLAEAFGRIRRLVADKGYNTDRLRNNLRRKGITSVVPCKRGRKRRIHHD